MDMSRPLLQMSMQQLEQEEKYLDIEIRILRKREEKLRLEKACYDLEYYLHAQHEQTRAEQDRQQQERMILERILAPVTRSRWEE